MELDVAVEEYGGDVVCAEISGEFIDKYNCKLQPLKKLY